MSETKKVLNFPIEDSEQLISIVEGITELNADVDLDSTPSSIEISVYGSEDEVKGISEKIRKLVEDSKTS